MSDQRQPPPSGPPPQGPPPGGGYGGGYGAQYPSGPGDSARAPKKGFFGSLFDFTFNHFITPIIVKVVYVLAFAALLIGWLIFIVAGFADSAATGLLALVLGAIGVLLYLCFIRMTLEFYIAIVRMSEDIHRRLPGA